MSTRTRAERWRVLLFREIAENITQRVEDPASSGLDYYVGLEHLDPDNVKISRWGPRATWRQQSFGSTRGT